MISRQPPNSPVLGSDEDGPNENLKLPKHPPLSGVSTLEDKQWVLTGFRYKHQSFKIEGAAESSITVN